MKKIIINLGEIKKIESAVKPIGFILANDVYKFKDNTWKGLGDAFIKAIENNFKKLHFNILAVLAKKGINLQVNSGEDFVNLFHNVQKVLSYKEDEIEIICVSN